jgi:acetoin:2,6-dichlorophenolindophenol oxidoreductase subunit alpha
MMELSKEKLLELLQTMLTIRAFETPLENLVFDGKIPGTVHQSIGQEATAVGTVAPLKKEDRIFTFHRSHGNLIAKGLEPKLMMAELWGKSTGYCKGKGGSMHITCPELGAMGSNGIVGIVSVLSNGPALYSKIKGTKTVSVAYFGDGASNQGSIHEAMNLASIWKLPTIFVLENNHYAESTPSEYACSVTDFTLRGKAHNIPSYNVEGSDVLEVYEKMSEAVNNARNGLGPSFLAVDLYRYKGHQIGEPEGYRTKEEIENYINTKDCINKFKVYLQDKQYLGEIEFENMKKKAEAIIDDAIKFADESPYPDVSEVYTDVYV